MLPSLADAVPDTSGAKAGTLGALLRAGLPVPDGFVIPLNTYRSAVGHQGADVTRGLPLSVELLSALANRLQSLGGPVAVRSSAADEDTIDRSAAGQYESVLGVSGIEGVTDAVRACWISLHASRAVECRAASNLGHSPADPAMAVLVQRHLDAEVSGVMFTPSNPQGTTVIEASWGLGVFVVAGMIDPDVYRIAHDGSITRVVADKRTRLDREGTQLVERAVPAAERDRPTLETATLARLTRLGQDVVALLDGPQDIEWAVVDDQIWILQARPITASPPLPAPSRVTADAPATLKGTPASQGTASGSARIVRGPADFARVRTGDILICPRTDPAWTPLLRVVGGVITETGGALSHAAIVARERGIPAVVGVSQATAILREGAVISIDGGAGTVNVTPSPGRSS